MKLPTRVHVLTAATALVAAAALVGCQQSSGTPSASAEEYPPSYRAEATPAAATIEPSSSASSASAAAATTSGESMRMTENKMYYPTGDRETSALLIEKSGPAQIRLGKEYTYQIKVTNLTNAPLQGVTIHESLPGSFSVSSSSTGGEAHGATPGEAQPAGHTTGGAAAGAASAEAQPAGHAMGGNAGTHTYAIGELGPKESRTISVTGTPSQAGQLSSCISASYNPTLCTTAMVTNPQMKILKEAVGAAGGDMCEPQTLRYTLTNTGTGDLSGVRVEDNLPAGLTTEDGASRVSFNVGSLAQGQTRAFEVKVKPQHGGEFASAATASADDGVTAKSDSAALNIKAPKLEVTLKAPEKQFIGEQVKYEVTVKNVGDAPARTPMVRIAQAGETMEGAQPAAATEGGQQVGELAPGASKTITVPFAARNEGDLKVNAIASDPCAGKAVMAAGQTRIASSPPALLLSAVDEHDPVRVGENVTYTITVLNQSAVPDRNIKVVVTLPDGEQYVSSTGVTQGNVAGNKITFAPVTTLNGKQSAVWTVTVKALKPADVQFRTDMSSESFPNAATKLEPTRLY